MASLLNELWMEPLYFYFSSPKEDRIINFDIETTTEEKEREKKWREGEKMPRDAIAGGISVSSEMARSPVVTSPTFLNSSQHREKQMSQLTRTLSRVYLLRLEASLTKQVMGVKIDHFADSAFTFGYSQLIAIGFYIFVPMSLCGSSKLRNR